MTKKSSTAKKLCFISEKVPDGLEHSIHNKICQNLPTILHNDKKHYCVLHLPDEKPDPSEFWNVFYERLDSQQNNFEYVYFSDVMLFPSSHKFSTETNFSNAIFTKFTQFTTATFEKATYFWGTEFKKEVNFEKSDFIENVSFNNATFNDKTSFSHTFFKSNVSFHSANFNEESHISFIDSDIRKTLSLENAKIKGYLTFIASPYVPKNLVFNGENAVLDLQNVKLEKTERVSFHSVRLQPNWFINVNCKNFAFTNCLWQSSDGIYMDKKSEFKALKRREIPNFYILLTKACRQLADNFEEAKSFRTASRFREIAMESKRLGRFKGFRIWSLHWWYWLLSVYGEDWKRAIVILFILLFGFALIYTQTNFQLCPSNQPYSMSIAECKTAHESCQCLNGGLSLKESVLQTFSTALFQNSEYRKPNSFWSEFWIILEKVLVPLQAALLALAIRRKFIR